MKQLNGKTAIIIGAASGMGKAAAILFASEGANVVLADLNVAGGEEAAGLASEAGPRCVFQRADVTSEADIAAMVSRALSEFGRLDVTFNNAGVGGRWGRWRRSPSRIGTAPRMSACAPPSWGSSTRSARCGP